MKRRLAAIVAADMVGYSRLIAAEEERVLARQTAHRKELIDPKIAEYGGRIVKTTGDGFLVEFPSVVDALRSAVGIQLAMAEREAARDEAQRIIYRMGINLGDIVIEDDDIYGNGVNVAASATDTKKPADTIDIIPIPKSRIVTSFFQALRRLGRRKTNLRGKSTRRRRRSGVPADRGTCARTACPRSRTRATPRS